MGCDSPELLMSHPDLAILNLSFLAFSPAVAIESCLCHIPLAKIESVRNMFFSFLSAMLEVIRTFIAWN